MSRHKSENPTSGWKGCLAEAKPLACPKCKNPNNFELYYYIDSSAWTDFEDRLRSHDGETFKCQKCGEKITIRPPLILDVPQRDLIVFATYGGDDGGVENGFRQFFEKMAACLPPEVTKAARKRPYTFVHGRRGLIALLDYFRDKPVEIEPEADPTKRGGSPGFSALQGYIYGKLFFYYAGQLAVQDLVGLVVGAALDLESAGHPQAAISLLEGVIARIGDTHPWLSHELGRLFLICGQAAEAKVWLLKAAERRHTWHAVTASFLDATPTRREDEEPQAAELPHAMPAESLGAITRSKHTVTGIQPPVKDFGLWDFPNMSQAAIPEEYTLENLIEVHAYVLGTFDRHLFRELNPGRLREATHVGWHRVQEASQEYLRYGEVDENAYWSLYVESRWGIQLDSDLTDRKTIATSVEAAHASLLEIERQLAMVPEEEDENPFMFFSKGYVASDVRFFLTNSARFIRKEFFERLKDTPEGLSRDLRHQLWRSVDELVGDARDSFDNVGDLKELVDYFRVYIPAIAARTADTLAYSPGGIPKASRTLLDEIRHFADSAFEESVSAGDLDFLSAAGTALDQSRCLPLGELLGHFVECIHKVGPKGIQLNHCLHRNLDGKCPVCLEETRVFVWDIINISARPDLEKSVKSSKAVIQRCNYCTADLPRRSPLLYCNPLRNLYLLLCPDMDEKHEESLRDYVSGYIKDLPLQHKGNRPDLLFCSQYVSRFENADQYVIVCRVRSYEEFLGIVKQRH